MTFARTRRRRHVGNAVDRGKPQLTEVLVTDRTIGGMCAEWQFCGAGHETRAVASSRVVYGPAVGGVS
jgi:hypothetical protein